jgi:hypothetical protein
VNIGIAVVAVFRDRNTVTVSIIAFIPYAITVGIRLVCVTGRRAVITNVNMTIIVHV